MAKTPQEILGSFYLGAKYDIDTQKTTDELVNYDARDLTTHAVCVGMTGSGKTGLCLGLLEEAAIDKVPAIIIDPKGDMTNLLLQFENLSPEDFKPWINADDANRKGKTVDEFATDTANMWKKGLADWGQDSERIKTLKKSVDYTIFTPGSNAGIPINILGSFAAPQIDFDSEEEMLHERIQGTVAALLGMVGSKEDPSRSREGILLATLFEHYWRKHEDLDLTKLIMGIQKPPFSQLGVFDVETFFPEKDRFDLAMDFNTLVASPQFKYWLIGETLDIDKIYFTAEGKPRHSIFYIAHLSDSERMFFVTLLLNSLITWMRRQSGTTSLRSLLYFDEIFGYFPPTANPPSKKPLMTILKQARAFGLGSVLVTQNPVDIDYKGLSNAGTWFIGKLQTERDKKRVLGGLEGAIAEAGGSSNLDFDKIITGLDSRVFLMHNVHDDAPIVYHTRWAMSYLRGPLTRPQLKSLMSDKKASSTNRKEKAIGKSVGLDQAKPVSIASAPSVDPSIEQRFFAVWKSASEAAQELGNKDGLRIEYKPLTMGLANVRFYDKKSGIDKVNSMANLTLPPDDFGRTDWDNSYQPEEWRRNLLDKPDHPDSVPVSYLGVPETMNTKKELSNVEDDFEDWIYQNKKLIRLEHKGFKIFQEAAESKEAFSMRVQQVARERRDEELDEMEEKYETKFNRVHEKIRKEEQDLNDAKADARSRRTQEAIGVAQTIFSVFIKGRSRSLSSAATKRRMSRKAGNKVQESKEDLMVLEDNLQDLEREFKGKLDDIKAKYKTMNEEITERIVKPRKTDIRVDKILLVWHPYWVSPAGDRVSARN